MMKFKTEKKELVYYTLRLYEKHYITATGGNISIRTAKGIILITPSQKDKGNLNISDIGEIDLQGNNLTPAIKLSMETMMHIQIYKQRNDANAVIHAHPPVATSFTATSLNINTHLTGEIFAIAGEPACVPYCLMGTDELAKLVADATLHSNIVLLKNHGITAIGPDLATAFARVEAIETAAQTTLYSRILGNIEEIPEPKRNEIIQFLKSKNQK